MLTAAVTVDTDTLETHFKGVGLKRENYTFLEYEQGMENLLHLLKEFNIEATFFFVGKDLVHQENVSILKEVVCAGHEIASHSMNHFQGFRLLKREEKIRELAEMEAILFKAVGEKPVGFRSPGWNIDDEALHILEDRGYSYDSSIFPSFFNPVMKIVHYMSTNGCIYPDRTTLGEMKYMFTSPEPHFLNKNGKGIIEFPVTVTPVFRVPFFATFLLATGINLFKPCYQLIKYFRRPIIFLFHLLDFVDFEHPEFKDQIPWRNKGVYIPASITTPFRKKYDIFKKAMEIMIEDYEFNTLEELAEQFRIKHSD